MEKIKSVKGKSPISLLKFQQKSDFKKFLKFIQDQTKELKGVKKPKENKIKSALKVGAIGLGGLGIAGLFGAAALGKDKDKDDSFKKSSDKDDKPNLLVIGRKNFPETGSKGIVRVSPRLSADQRGFKIKPVRVTESKTRPSKAKVNVPKPTLLKKSRGRVVTKEFAKVKEAVKASGQSESVRKRIKQKVDAKPEDVKASKKVNKILRNVTKTRNIAPRTFDIKDPNFVNDMKEVQKIISETNKGKIKSKTPKQLVDRFNRIRRSLDLNKFDPEAEGRVLDAQMDPNLKKLDRINKAFDNLLDVVNKSDVAEKFKKLRKGVEGFSKPSSLLRDNLMLSENKFKGKSKFAQFTRKVFRGNKKITKDTSRLFFGMGYKGPKLSALSGLVSNPLAKVIFIGVDIFAAISSGRQIINPKDNIGTALYDLFTAMYNSGVGLLTDNPKYLRYFKGESSKSAPLFGITNEMIRDREIERNLKIKKLKEEAVRGGGGNNIIVVPQSGNKRGSGVNNIPTRTGGVDLSLLPFEPLNIGDDILLHKLNQ